MKAILYDTFAGPLKLETVPDPQLPPDGVIIQVRANGICRSDWHGWQGHDADIRQFPHVPGHELAGDIVAVGPLVKRWKIGQRVTVPFCLGCGSCPQCQTGNQQICDQYYQPGFSGWGAFAEYVALPYADVNLVSIPESLDYADVASLGCRFSTAFRALIAQAQLQAGEWLAVHGCGGIGLSAVMIGLAQGAQVIAVDIQDEALNIAADLGATVCINPLKTDVLTAIHTVSKGGVHVSMDALGSAVTCRNSILSLRKRGRHLQVGLLTDQDENPALPMGPVISKELEIYGSHGMQAHAYDALFSMIESGKLSPQKLITERVSLAESPQILQRMTDFKVAGITIIDRF